MKPGGNGKREEVRKGEIGGEKGAESGDLILPVCSKPHVNHPLENNRRSPPVLTFGIGWRIILVSGLNPELGGTLFPA